MGSNISTNAGIKFNIISEKYEANLLLRQAEEIDAYLQDCYDDPSNSKARRNMTYTPNKIGIEETNHAYIFLHTTPIPQRLIMDLNTINIIQLMPTADGGMPHTRPNNIICLPDISQLFSSTTLIHELWHVHQRLNKDLWSHIFRNLGWVEWTEDLPYNLENNRRYNPDTIDSPLWIYKNTWIAMPIFRDISQPKVNDVDIWFYNPHKQYHVKSVPDDIKEYYGNLPAAAFEHPREITAYILSEPDKYTNTRGFKELIESLGSTAIQKYDK